MTEEESVINEMFDQMDAQVSILEQNGFPIFRLHAAMMKLVEETEFVTKDNVTQMVTKGSFELPPSVTDGEIELIAQRLMKLLSRVACIVYKEVKYSEDIALANSQVDEIFNQISISFEK